MAFAIHPESPNKHAVSFVEGVFREYEPRVRELLPELSDNLQVYVYDEDIIPETGTGGYAYSPSILSLSLDNNFVAKKRQRNALVGTIFHESFHLVQGHTAHDSHASYTSALDSAIYEGCATVFEREYTDEQPLWGDYSMHSSSDLRNWRDALSHISPEEWLRNDGELWKRWSFYDADDGQRWKAYKVGVWTVDSCLRQTGKDIRDMRLMAASDFY
jgi:uncharacterized protein YjaZ